MCACVVWGLTGLSCGVWVQVVVELWIWGGGGGWELQGFRGPDAG